MNIRPIKTERDYKAALRRVDELWNSPQGSPEEDELTVLATLIDAYEDEHYPVNLPDPIEAIKFRLEQQGLDRRALIGVIGQRSRDYEILSGKRTLTLNMIRTLREKFGISADALIQDLRKHRRRRERETIPLERQLKKSAYN